MINNTDLTRQTLIDLAKEFVTTNAVVTPLSSLLYSKSKNYNYNKDIVVRKKIKTLSNVASGARKEGQDAPADEKSTFAWIENNMEIFSKATSVSGTVGAISGSDKVALAKEINDRLIELKGDIENSFINGVKKAEDGVSGRRMNGLINQVHADNVVDCTSSALTEAKILDALQKIFDAGMANGELYLVCNATTKRKINEIYKDQEKAVIPLVAGDGNVGIVVQKIFTDFGVVNILMDSYVPVGNILIFNLDLVDVPELRTPTFEALAKTGDSEKGQVVAECSILTAPKSMAKIINFI